MHNGTNHWLISFSSNNRAQICNSLYTNLTLVIKNCLKPSTSLKLKKTEIISYHGTSAEAERWLQLRIVCSCVFNGCTERIVSCQLLFLFKPNVQPPTSMS